MWAPKQLLTFVFGSVSVPSYPSTPVCIGVQISHLLTDLVHILLGHSIYLAYPFSPPIQIPWAPYSGSF